MNWGTCGVSGADIYPRSNLVRCRFWNELFSPCAWQGLSSNNRVCAQGGRLTCRMRSGTHSNAPFGGVVMAAAVTPCERKAKTHFGSNARSSSAVSCCCWHQGSPGICARATGVENGHVIQQRERGPKALRQWLRRSGRSELFLCEGVFLLGSQLSKRCPGRLKRCHLQKCKSSAMLLKRCQYRKRQTTHKCTGHPAQGNNLHVAYCYGRLNIFHPGRASSVHVSCDMMLLSLRER